MNKTYDLQVRRMQLEEVEKMIDNLEEPSNRWNLGLNNQEKLAYFNGYEDTIKELKSKIKDLKEEQKEK